VLGLLRYALGVVVLLAPLVDQAAAQIAANTRNLGQTARSGPVISRGWTTKALFDLQARAYR
jgi:hypothetical protein